LHRLETVLTHISLWMSRFGGLCLLAAAVLIAFEILARKFLLLPFNVGTELAAYALAIGASWSFAYALLHRAHVRIDVIYRLCSPLLRALLDVLALLSLAGLAVMLTWHAWVTVETSLTLNARENTPLGTPLAIPQGLWLVGMAWFSLVSIQQAVAVMLTLARGDITGVLKAAGPVAFEEELEEALSDAEARLKQAA
jgi:TRAP-type mannitol/chloroaromatic compound transport system permease small subunit